ncbi:hypothetical protein [Cohnella boryungensis]|uniref:Uncharacterized protein n=1 Tax=Cohnella boryungensis TaxID=768479 RepID=A0ABV8SD97_9BACL
MEISVNKLKYAECGTVFYSGPDEDEYDKCPMSFCKDGYGYEVDEIAYDINVNKTTGKVTIEQRIPPNDVIRIK